MQVADAHRYLEAHLNREAVAGRHEGLSLEPVTRLLSALGDPQTAYPVFHITGTNGKGSVARMISSLLEVHGLSVGLYSSPHLERVNERLARNREPCSDDEFASAVGAVASVEGLVDVTPSYFEILTAAALGWFAETAVDVAVVEVGLLGAYDATNVVRPAVAVVTNVGKDHTDGRGDWRRAVAEEKAGIIETGSVAVVGETTPDLLEVFESRAAAELWVRGDQYDVLRNELAVGGRVLDIRAVHGRYEQIYLSVHGAHQGDNAATALASAEAFFGRALAVDLVAEAFGSLELPGRFEVLGRHPLVVTDAAHNPPAARALRATLDDMAPGERRFFVLGLLEGRDPDELLEALGAHSGDVVITCRPDSPRAVDDRELEVVARRRGLDAEAAGTVADALARARAQADESDQIVATGSTYVAGAARSVWLGLSG